MSYESLKNMAEDKLNKRVVRYCRRMEIDVDKWIEWYKRTYKNEYYGADDADTGMDSEV